MKPIRTEDMSFCQIAMSSGVVTLSQVKECLDAQKHLQDLGLEAKSVLQIMIEKGYLDENGAAQILASAHDPEPDIPRLHGYEILCPLSSGGMGMTFVAKQTSCQRPVILKVLHRDLSKDEYYVKRFLNECLVHAQLNHPNIVHVIDSGVSDGLQYCVMEYVEGMPLSTLLEENKHLSETACLKIGKQMLSAIKYLASQNIVHRDLKPDNIILSRTGLAKLCDFGISKRQDTGQGVTLAGEIVGTPDYIAPEMVAGGGSVDWRADVYSLGATLYHLVTGVPVFQAKTTVEAMYKHLNEKPAPPRLHRPNISETLNQLILRMLEKDPARRAGDPKDLLHDFADALDGKIEELPPPPPKPARRLRRTTLFRRSKRVAWEWPAAGVCSVVIALVALHFTGVGSTPPSPNVSLKPQPAPIVLEARDTTATNTTKDDLERSFDQRYQAYQIVRLRNFPKTGEPEDLNSVYELAVRAMEEFRDTRFSAAWKEELDRFKQEATARIDEIWDQVKKRAEELERKDQWRAALAAIEKFPDRLLNFTDAFIAPRAVKEQPFYLAQYREKIGGRYERLRKDLSEALTRGLFLRAWDLTDQMDELGIHEKAAEIARRRQEVLQEELNRGHPTPCTSACYHQLSKRLREIMARYDNLSALVEYAQECQKKLDETFAALANPNK